MLNENLLNWAFSQKLLAEKAMTNKGYEVCMFDCLWVREAAGWDGLVLYKCTGHVLTTYKFNMTWNKNTEQIYSITGYLTSLPIKHSNSKWSFLVGNPLKTYLGFHHNFNNVQTNSARREKLERAWEKWVHPPKFITIRIEIPSWTTLIGIPCWLQT